jgi:hypothetical protein
MAKDEQTVEPAAVEEVKPAADMSAEEIKDALTFQEDRDLHPSGKPKGTEAEPGGPPAVEPNRPPYSTNRGDVPILTSLATGSGAHTPPDPAHVDVDGHVRPLKAEEGK